jgi:hypothetical protein
MTTEIEAGKKWRVDLPKGSIDIDLVTAERANPGTWYGFDFRTQNRVDRQWYVQDETEDIPVFGDRLFSRIIKCAYKNLL